MMHKLLYYKIAILSGTFVYRNIGILTQIFNDLHEQQ